MKIKLLHPALLALTLNAFGTFSAWAQGTSAVTFPAPANPISPPTRLTLGYDFSVTTVMQATALSFYDYGADGLALNHPVGLWLNNFNLGAAAAMNLATVTVTTNNPLQDSFRYVTLSTPVVLSPGMTYTLGAYTQPNGQALTDPFFSQVTNPTYAPGFTFGRTVTSFESDGLMVPTSDPNISGAGYFGPGILLAPVVTIIPEPTTWVMTLVGAGLFLAVTCLRRPRTT